MGWKLLLMPIVKIDRDMVLDKIYECRGQIDFTNQDALKKLSELMDIIIHAPDADNQAMYPKIKFGR